MQNNVHLKKVHCAYRQPSGLCAPQEVEMGGDGSISERIDKVLGLSWGNNNVPCEVP